jgi:hypothetical protein
MLTTAVFAVIITAPLGAIMINTLGTKWLIYDGDETAANSSSSQDGMVIEVCKKKQDGVDLEDSMRVQDISGFEVNVGDSTTQTPAKEARINRVTPAAANSGDSERHAFEVNEQTMRVGQEEIAANKGAM